MRPAVGTAAACSKLSLAGLRASTSSGTDTYSANAPPLRHWMPLTVSPNTSSPAWNRVTARPTDSTRPAMSMPGTRCLGRRTPLPISRSTCGRPRTVCQTSGCTDAACTRTSSSSSATAGGSMSRIRRTSGGP